jgi:uncharacterized protein involved in exopolysaccharide biosynthesis
MTTTEAGPGARTGPAADDRRFLLAEVIAILATWRRAIVAFAGGVLLVTILVTLFARPTFVARTTLMPQEEKTEFGNLSSLVATQFGSFAGGLVGITTSTDILMTIAESRRLRERVIERLGLEDALGIKGKTPAARRENALARLSRMVSLTLSKRLSIVVDVRAPSAELASGIANTYVEELDRLNQELSLESVRQRREFLEARIHEARDSLATSQERLELFQQRHGMIALDEQAKAAVEVAARLQGELLSLEAQLEVQRRYSSSGFSRTRDLEYRVAAVRSRLRELMGGSSAGRSADTGSGVVRSFSELPGLGRQLADHLLEAKTYEAVYTLLAAQYQQSRIEEARNTPTVQVLDKAMPPPFRDTPRRKMNLLVGLMTGVGGGCLLAMALEYLYRTVRRPGMPEILARLGWPFRGLAAGLDRLRAS